MMNAAKKDFYTNFIAENSTDQGKLFRAAKKLLGKKEVPSFPNYVDKSVLANDIGKFFIRKIESIRSDIDKVVNSCALTLSYRRIQRLARKKHCMLSILSERTKSEACPTICKEILSTSSSSNIACGLLSRCATSGHYAHN